MKSLKEISYALNDIGNENNILCFLTEILSKSELETLSKRWRILKMLKEGRTQRDIAKELNVSLCKVTRGAKLLHKESISAKYL